MESIGFGKYLLLPSIIVMIYLSFKYPKEK